MIDNNSADTVPLRRSKRSSAAISPIKPSETSTPSGKRPQKRARFSEPLLSRDTTGLTPAVGKASLKTPKRRVSTPAITRYQDHDEIQFTPLRQALDGRTTRRIRRHGLSDEQNQHYSDKKSKAELQRQLDQKNKELQNLKEELEASKLREASILHSDLFGSQERISQLEDEVAELTQRSERDDTGLGSSSPQFDDDCGFQIYEDESINKENEGEEEDDVTVDLELESARQAKEELFRSSQSFTNLVVQFEDSPVRSSNARQSTLATPRVDSHDLSKEINAAINRAEEAEVALQAMTTEIKSLGFPYTSNENASEFLSSIKSHFHDMRFELERTVPGESTISFHNARLMPEILSKLKIVASQLRGREAELRSMREQQRSLRGNFDHALIATEKATAQVKELEDIIDKNAEEMLEQRMRCQALEREAKEHGKNNQSLITAIEKYRQEVKRLEDLVELIELEQASRLQDVRTATTAEFSQQLSDMDANVASETRGRRAAEESAVERLRKINDLESELSRARQESEDVNEQLQSLEEQHSASTRAHEEEITAADTQIEKLTNHIGKLETLYRNEVERGAQYADQRNRDLLRAATVSAEEKKKYIRGSKVRLANWELESDDLPSDPIVGPMTPSSIVRFSEFSEMEGDTSAGEGQESDDHVEGRITLSRGTKHRRQSSVDLPASSPFLGAGILKKRPRRKYDSGIGMDSLSEAEDESEGGAMTPDLSSEADVDVENEVMV